MSLSQFFVLYRYGIWIQLMIGKPGVELESDPDSADQYGRDADTGSNYVRILRDPDQQ